MSTRSAEWSARLIIAFVGVPSIGFALTAGVLNTQSAAAIATSDSQERVFAACAVCATAFAVAMPMAKQVLRVSTDELAAVAHAVWIAALGLTALAAIVATSNNVSLHRADALTIIGRTVVAGAPGVPFAVLVALLEVGAAYGLALTVRTVRELLEPQQAQQAVEPKPELKPAVAAAPQAAPIDPEVGWRTWFQACVTITKGGRVPAKEAYAHYEAWAGLNNIPEILPLVTFGRRMTEAVKMLGGKVAHSNGRHYANVSLAHLGADGELIKEPDLTDA